MGMDLSRYADQEKGVRPPLLDAEKVKQGTATALTKLRAASLRFADWTIQLGQKADIPTRVEKMEIPRRTKDLARRSGAAAAEATRTAAEATRAAAEETAKASKASAAKSKEIWEKMALADKVGKMTSEAGRGLTDMADKTKQSLGQVARASKETIDETAEKLRPHPREEEAPPPPLSGLEQLLAREEQEERKAAEAKSTAELPLFSEEQSGPTAQPVDPQTEQAAPPALPVPPVSDGMAAGAAVPMATPIAPAMATPVATPVAPFPPTDTAESASSTPASHPAPAAAHDNIPPAATLATQPAPAVSAPAAITPAQTAAPATAVPAAAPAPAPSPTETPHPIPHPTQPETIADRPAPAAPASPAAAPTTPTAPATPSGDARAVPSYEVVNRAPAAAPYAAAPILPAFSARTWALGGAALIALLGSSYWLGSRFGGGMSKADVETIVADYITTNPQIIPAALEAQRGREIAKAIDSVRPALEKPYAGAWGGNADGDVTLVVFTDYACGFCRASVPDIDRLLREDKRLKVVYRELPIISRESRSAALMALAAARQGKYDAFHHAMFAQSSLAPSAIIKAAEQSGVSLDGSGDATADEALFQRELESNLALGNQLQLNATPTWVIGDQLMQGQVGYDALREAIARTRTKQAG